MSQYRLNWKFLLGFLAVVAIGGGLLHARYKRQVGKQADTLLELANGADQKGDAGKAVGFLRRYLVFRPLDTDARGRLGLLLARVARQPAEHLQAYFVLDETLRAAPDRADLRRKAVDLALRLGPDLLPDVQRHLEGLKKTDDAKGEFYLRYADFHLVQSQYSQAIDKLERATDKQPNLFAAYVRRAHILRKNLDRSDEADKVIAAMVDKNKGAYLAHLGAAVYWDTDTSPPRPARDPEQNYADQVKAANDLAPDELDVILAVADRDLRVAGRAALQNNDEQRKKSLDEARATLRRGTGRYVSTLQKLTAEEAARLDEEAFGKRALVGVLFQKLVASESMAGDMTAAEAAAREGVTALPESILLQLTLLDVHIRQGKFDEAGVEVGRLKQAGVPAPVIDYHKSRILASRPVNPDRLTAARTLEAVLAQPGLPTEFVAPAALLLGACYEQIGEYDRRYAAYKRAAEVTDVRDPLWQTANERLAAALMETGQVAEAAQLLEELAPRAVGAYVGVYIPLARARLVLTLGRPEGQRDWTPVEDALEKVSGVEASLVWADLYLARGEQDKATDKLRAAIKEHPDAVRPQLALALTEARRKNTDGARELIEAARAKFGNTADVRLAEARLVILTPGPDTAARLARLADGADQLPHEDSRRLLRGLAELAAAAGATDTAAALHNQRAAAAPDDLGAHLARFDDALAKKDFAEAGRVLTEIEKIDKPSGTNTQVAQAFLQIALYQHDKSGNLAVARERLDAVERQRRWWPRAALAQALVADLRGADPTLKADEHWAEQVKAADRYKAAFEGGEQRPEVVQRLLALYAALGKTNAGEELLNRVDPRGLAAGSELLVLELSLRSGNLKRAMAFATKAIAETDTDPVKLVRLSQIRELAREPDDRVLAPLRRAVEVAGDRPEGWVYLVRYLARTDRKAQAETEAERARVRLGDREKLAVAQCLVAVGRPERAIDLYEGAVKDRPTDVRTLSEAMLFHLRTENIDKDARQKAERLSEAILRLPNLPPDVQVTVHEVQTRLRLGRSDFQMTRQQLEAAGVLERGVPVRLTGRESVSQLRTRALSLARQPDAALRREAINTFEAIDQRQRLRAEDQFLLSQLLISVGQWPAARSRLKALTEAPDPNLAHVAYYGLRVLLLDEAPNTREARRCLDLLDKGQPNAPVTIELKARLLDAERNLAGAVEAVKGYVGRDESRAGVGALLLERLGAVEPAETMYRTFAADPKQVGGTVMLAGFLGRQGRTGDAVALLAERSGALPPAVIAGVGVEVLYHSPQATADAVRQVEGWVQQAAQKGLPEAEALALRGVIKVVEGKYEDAIRLNQAAVSKGTPDPLTMNNLGYLLAVHGGRVAEGLAWVTKARDAAGPLPAIRDTEAVIRTVNKEPQKAIDLLVDATREIPDPAAFFHLAEAYREAGDTAAAAAAMRQAKRWKISLIDVPPQERSRLRDALRTVR